MKFRLASSLFFLVVAFCAAQDILRNAGRSNLSTSFDSGVEITGEIKHPAEVAVRNLTVELVDPVRHSAPQRAAVSAGGDFRFNGLPMGTYLFRVLSLAGTPITEKIVAVREAFNQITLELPVDDNAKPGAGTVSLAHLLHGVPPEAMKNYNSALKAMQKKNTERAITFLEKAVAIDPHFVEAQTNLGELYVQKHEPDKVLAAFNEVLKIDPRSQAAISGSSVAQLWLDRYADAEHSARRALEINPSSAISHYFLGLSLAAQNKDDNEAVQHLNQCSNNFPMARLTAARVLARQRNFSAATAQLQSYLQSGTTTQRDAVVLWIEDLKHQEQRGSGLK